MNINKHEQNIQDNITALMILSNVPVNKGIDDNNYRTNNDKRIAMGLIGERRP